MTHQQNFQIVKELEYHSWRMKKKERNRVKKEKNTEKRKEYVEVIALIPYQQCNENMKTDKSEKEMEKKLCIYSIYKLLYE
jgi:hypothetical protein